MPDPSSSVAYETICGIPTHVVAYAAGAFTICVWGGQRDHDPALDWKKVAHVMQGLGVDHGWEKWREACSTWASENLPREILLARRWF